MSLKKNICMFLVLAMAPMAVNAATSVPPGYDPSLTASVTPVPPHLPQYLPNGAINLDEVWIRDGGARLYWNSVIVPRQLKMAGAVWVDPALVPQLFPDPAPVRRTYRKTTRSRIAKAKVPAKVASTALKTPAIPVPVTPMAEEKPAPAVKAAPARPKTTQAAPRDARNATADTTVPAQPPRLQ